MMAVGRNLTLSAHGFEHALIGLVADEVKSPRIAFELIPEHRQAMAHALDPEGLNGAADLLEMPAARHGDLAPARRARVEGVAEHRRPTAMARRDDRSCGPVAPQHRRRAIVVVDRLGERFRDDEQHVVRELLGLHQGEHVELGVEARAGRIDVDGRHFHLECARDRARFRRDLPIRAGATRDHHADVVTRDPRTCESGVGGSLPHVRVRVRGHLAPLLPAAERGALGERGSLHRLPRAQALARHRLAGLRAHHLLHPVGALAIGAAVAL